MRNKICKSCNTEFPLSKFSRKGTGYRTACKNCHNRYVREIWYPKNKEKQKSASRLYKMNNKIKVKATQYGIELEVLEQALTDAKGKCRICNLKKTLVIDHCHKTGKFRGLLCNPCNTGLGMFRDNKKNLLAAVEYL